jgi:hypothetical protein
VPQAHATTHTHAGATAGAAGAPCTLWAHALRCRASHTSSEVPAAGRVACPSEVPGAHAALRPWCVSCAPCAQLRNCKRHDHGPCRKQCGPVAATHALVGPAGLRAPVGTTQSKLGWACVVGPTRPHPGQSGWPSPIGPNTAWLWHWRPCVEPTRWSRPGWEWGAGVVAIPPSVVLGEHLFTVVTMGTPLAQVAQVAQT